MLHDISVVIPCIDFVEQVSSPSAQTQGLQPRARKTRENKMIKEIAVEKQMIMNIVIYKFMDAAVAVAVIVASSRRSPRSSRPCTASS